jgi:hypothetical protein
MELIPAGTILYRASPDICSYGSNLCNQKRQCENTTKTGVYFSTYILQALAMAIEYDRDLELGIFVTTAPISVRIGKYSFRNIHPERWKIWPKNHILIENENISHFNSDMQPIITFNNVPINYAQFDLNPGEGELFLTKKEELDAIRLEETYKISVDALKRLIKTAFFNRGYRFIPTNDIGLYKRSGCITPFMCPPKGGKRKTRSRRLVRVRKP